MALRFFFFVLLKYCSHAAAKAVSRVMLTVLALLTYLTTQRFINAQQFQLRTWDPHEMPSRKQRNEDGAAQPAHRSHRLIFIGHQLGTKAAFDWSSLHRQSALVPACARARSPEASPSKPNRTILTQKARPETAKTTRNASHPEAHDLHAQKEALVWSALNTEQAP